MTDHVPTRRTLAWNSLIDHSVEICWVQANGDDWTFTAAATLVEDERPFAIDYEVHLNRSSGRTRFEARVRSGSPRERRMALSGCPGEVWQLIGGDQGETVTLSGGTCIDLGWTPLTNTFSIWTLDLAVGASAEITNVWIPFPALTIQESIQRYTRLSQHRFLYEQAGIDFRAELEVDEDGFVRQYGDIWEAVTIVNGVERWEPV